MKKPAIKWTIHEAAREFNIARETLNKRLAAQGCKPDATGCFSTAQITSAIFGDRERERLRKLTAEANLASMKFDEQCNRLVPLEWCSDFLRKLLAELTTTINNSALPPETKSEVLRNLAAIDIDKIGAESFAKKPWMDAYAE
jgi:hypothetical protein